MVLNKTDLNLTTRDISALASVDALAAFLMALGYDTSARKPLTPEAIGLAGDAATPIKKIELLSEDAEGFLRVVFVQLRSLTAKSRTDLARVLGRANVDHLLVLTSDFSSLEFVLLDKRRRDVRGPAGLNRIQVVPLTLAVERKAPGTKELRAVRRFTWTGRDGLEQFDKLRSTFEAAAFAEDYFCNRALFADHYLLTRLREDAAWRDNPTQPFQRVKDLLRDARSRWLGKGEQIVRDELFAPIFKLLGFQSKVNKGPGDAQTRPDYLLSDATGQTLTAAFVYAWDRWLDGPDFNLDAATPDENPGASVVTALEEGVADWIIVTNGRQWRLYSRHAHSRATNFYEVDLTETLVSSGDTDPNEAFRYWWLFFRAAAFLPLPLGEGRREGRGCWLDTIAEGSRDYAKQLGERLKERIFVTIFPHLAQGFLEDRKSRLGIKGKPTEEELRDIFEATLTLLYRLLFLLYAEARDLLPIREAPYRAASLKKIKDEIAEAGGIAESEVAERLKKAYSTSETALFDRLQALFAAMDRGNPTLNVPTYNGGLFITKPAKPTQNRPEPRELRIARFLCEHKISDRHLALAVDRLSRDEDDKTFKLGSIDYKSLEVRHLGSIYEGLLEFKLKIADEDLTTQSDKKKETYIPLTQAKSKRGRAAEAVVRKGAVYLSNDKAERKASGSYYTPDPIVEYIVEQTVGPVLAEKLETLRPEFRKVRKTFNNEVQKATAYPVKTTSGESRDPRDFAAEKTYAAHRELVEQLFELRVLDPAMGSGHFLVEAVDFITDRLLTFLNQFPINPVTFMLGETRRRIIEALSEQGVTADPDKLTDINLLKRHVLKRSIYGVDLNPMAVELAKVSLWLDAFTLGAPLSFLKHHLRCGNSLIGATFADMESLLKASKNKAGMLFGVDYEPMLRAVQHVLHVNRMSDATAAEVKQSASEYDQARDELSGYEILLDLCTAQFFHLPEAADLLRYYGNQLDLSGRAQLLRSLEGLDDLAVLERVSGLSEQPQFNFFHWEIEFPEVFFGFADAGQRRLKSKNQMAEGSAGFDAVIGNPPYVRMELIKPQKPFLKPRFRCHAERADLFIYFFEQAVRLLRTGGRTAFIASSTWTKTKAGEGLREYLQAEATVESFLDFGDLPVFADATTYPAIMVVRRTAPQPKHVIASAVVPDLEELQLARVLASRRIDVPQAELETSGWSFEDRRIARLREKIRAAGIPLKEYCGSPLYGIKTGLNEAFVIDTPTYERLVAEDRRSKEILKPFLEGKDLKPWRYEWRGLYLIYTHHGIDISRYPAIKRHLSTYRKRLEERATSESHEWYELQQPQLAYTARMLEPKIMYPDITVEPRFVYDDKGFFFGNTTYFLPNADRYLQGVLNSQVAWWHLSRSVRLMRGGYLRLFTQYVEEIPIAKATPDARREVARIANALSSTTTNSRLALESELNDRVAALYGLTAEERGLLRRGDLPPVEGALDDEE